MKKTFGDLKVGDVVWYTYNLKDWTKPEPFTILSIESIQCYSSHIRLHIELDKKSNWSITPNENETIDPYSGSTGYKGEYFTTRNGAIDEMIRRWQGHVDDCNEKIREIERQRDDSQKLIDDLILENHDSYIYGEDEKDD